MKTELLQVRVSPKLKRILAEAASRCGISVSEYVRVVVGSQSRSDIEKKTWVLENHKAKK